MRMHVRIWHPDELVTRPDGETISVTELFGESGFPVGQSKLCHEDLCRHTKRRLQYTISEFVVGFHEKTCI